MPVPQADAGQDPDPPRPSTMRFRAAVLQVTQKQNAPRGVVESDLQYSLAFGLGPRKAGEEIRTLDIYLGKVALYH